MSIGYGWEGIMQVCATLLGARHVYQRLCGGSASTWPLGRYTVCFNKFCVQYMYKCTTV